MGVHASSGARLDVVGVAGLLRALFVSLNLGPPAVRDLEPFFGLLASACISPMRGDISFSCCGNGRRQRGHGRGPCGAKEEEHADQCRCRKHGHGRRLLAGEHGAEQAFVRAQMLSGQRETAPQSACQ